jgi:hypothetical protein
MSATTVETAVHVRWAIKRDVPAMAAIEAANGRGTAAADLLADLARHDTIGLVAERARPTDEVVSFAVYRLEPAAVVVTRFGVLPGRFGRGPLVDRLHAKAEAHRRRLAVPVPAACATDTVRALCRGPQPAPAAVLADALEDAGDPGAWLLAALREPTPAAERLARAVAWEFERAELDELLAVQERDRLTRAVTAFEDWAEFEAAMRGGYVPTLRPAARPGRGRRQREWDADVGRLTAAVRAAGFKVFDGLRAE